MTSQGFQIEYVPIIYNLRNQKMIFTNTNTKELMNFQIPKPLKDKFHKKCNENYG